MNLYILMYTRTLQNTIEQHLFKKKIIILYGARQVGKTTLCQKIAENSGTAYRYLNCEDSDVRAGLSELSRNALQAFIGTYPLVIFDEAQTIPNIGRILKILYDNNPSQQIIATGSSSFELAQKTSEPLTGRALTFTLYPLSVNEIRGNHDQLLEKSTLDKILRFGSYPDIISTDESSCNFYLKELQSRYLYKDILTFDTVKKPIIIEKLLQLLAYQLGSEVSLNELSKTLGIHIATVDKYIDILEKMFIIFRLRSWSKNQRKEIGKKQKIYFWDCGIRNSIIQQHGNLELRPDKGALRENFCTSERLKKNAYSLQQTQHYFWRSYQQQEVDFIEQNQGTLHAYEYKRNQKSKTKIPPSFKKEYPDIGFSVIHTGNYHTFI